MRAILLAAGKGERLRDITKSIPKPMLKIKGKPILEHNIEWLKSHGITKIYINLHHLPDVITDYFEDGEKFGVSIKYSYEPQLLGTAGAVRKILVNNWEEVEKGDFEPLVVIYGDNLVNFNLKEILDFHKRKGGVATIVVYEKEDVSQSGIVLLDKNDRVLKFIEKPRPEERLSHLVNAGIYILETKVIINYIPADRYSDFGKDIFPSMLKKGAKIFAIKMKGELIAVDTPELLNKALNLNQDMRGK
ncbi:Nucleotidyl transferase [Candidatus Kryptonium thompsonii]|uniref:Nucleotidyl transferase n=1 Tax=Candidatus Kryptonium thompsonii TaxID=1633631 RepID=A0A0P1MWL6_9BACT|nr:nucleotidyltransferase family protein [Candidatus Kryptonium thompsoni]CUS76667.1 Nucleotidyl transferase [Candidatus Kryptonium thompsoni]CUS76860.1 Nucleotidyl transferase [Candidatus Kryptonium thompsoni]CUS77785.1 Nucleotidyl transferase [Candidatus Kryptonium thompsoni]CUS83907.1 Nucleotidyl transferase [Candidatus Kryptonium thompsoni]CUS84113.1 Nucleotidyl transferase [Candidatus Kryptonium thompsoni]